MARVVPLLAAAAASALACLPPQSGPPFVEPEWGNAPPPLAYEITEITANWQHCTQTCQRDEVLLLRDGQALRTLYSSGRRDSVMYGRVDSLTFLALATALRDPQFFLGPGDEPARMPLTNQSMVLSIATLCRRHVLNFYSPDDRPSVRAKAQAALDSAVAAIRWTRSLGGRG